MGAILENDHGKITFTDEYISNIAGLSAMECYGVVGMTAITAREGINEILKREDYRKGVRIITDETHQLAIQLNIIVEYGTSLAVIGKSIIETVRYNVENATGLVVRDIEVVISGIRVH